ncbi:hypothetical protein C1H46_026606 [Malus baccata]|uniref:Uncharacterized protein n=1 Tax=Malus baccata TaxID=106549 RepID=A0A540LMX0_MALBA|nr:hypothetical protein C1H46_026606 [Malus baccata]
MLHNMWSEPPTSNASTLASVVDEPPSSLPLLSLKSVAPFVRVRVSLSSFGYSANRSICVDEATAPSIASASTSVPPLQVFVDELSRRNGLPSTTPLRSEGTFNPSFLLLDKMSNLEVEPDAKQGKCNLKNDSAPDVPG